MTGKVLTFYLYDNLYGVDITLIKEINRNVDFTPVPDSSPNIVGLLNLRGQIVTLFNLAKLIGIDYEGKKNSTSCIILKAPPNDPNQIGFLIDSFGDVVDIGEDICESPPANVDSMEVEFISSVVKLKDELLMIIDPKKAFI